MRYGLVLLLIAAAVILVIYTTKTGKEEANIVRQIAVVDRARAVSLQSQMAEVAQALSTYAEEHDGFPQDLNELVPNYVRLESQLLDPWGQPLIVEGAGEGAQLVSLGPDGIAGTPDDVRRSL